MRWIPGRALMETCDFSVITSWRSLDLHVSVGVFLRVYCVLFGHLSVGLLLVTTFVELLLVTIVSLCALL